MFIFIILGLWFVVIVTLGMTGFFIPTPGQLPWQLYTAVFLPTIFFIGAYYVSPVAKKWVQHIDPFLVTLFQTWRVIGFTLLALAAFGIVDLYVAYLGGFGDVLIGFAAVYVVYRLKQHPAFISNNTFAWFHYIGLLDFAVAILTGTYYNQFYPELIIRLFKYPMLLIPTYFVPFLIISHIIALIHHHQSRQHMT